MTIQDLKDQQLIIYECISGSKAYGLDLPESDTDIKGVFLLPQDRLFGLEYVPQVANASNDEVYYELGRFIELLAKNNPNILELLATPEDKVLYKHPIFQALRPELFLSKKCRDTFAGYAFTQVKKARGLNKKIVNPVEQRRKSILEFCYILEGQGSVLLTAWLEKKAYRQEYCGLINIPHCKDVYGLFYDPDETLGYRGIMKKENATAVLLSSIPKGAEVAAYLFFHQDGYVQYCKAYRQYWEWVDNRNEVRYQHNVEHGKNYDSKNMMHTFRLLDMAIEILQDGMVNVQRPNREELLAIRRGCYHYDELINMAEAKMTEVDAAWQQSQLPEEPDMERIETLLIQLRRQLYQGV